MKKLLLVLFLIFPPLIADTRTWSLGGQIRVTLPHFPLLPKGGDRELHAKAVARAADQEIRRQQVFPPYTAPADYFEQRVDDVGIREWKPDPQTLPPLAAIVARPVQDRPVYGLYCWAEEYAKAADEVEKVGFRSMRFSGPWSKADEALETAARKKLEILFTLRGGDTPEAFRRKRSDGFADDEAFIRSFEENVKAFLRRYGPGSAFFVDKGLQSPLRMVEIWNEPNFQYMIPDSGNRAEDEAAREALYAKLLPRGYDAVKAVAPGVQVGAFAAGGSASGDVRFIQRILDGGPGLTQKFDVLTTHPYTMGAPPEAQKYRKWGGYSIANNLQVIRKVLDRNGSENTPVWYTEMGWQFSREHGGSFSDRKHELGSMVTPDLHAAYTVRNYLWALRLGVDRVFIMHLYDSDHYNCGFFERDTLKWRPVAHAVRNQIRLLPHPKLTGAQRDGEDGVFVYDFLADASAPDAARISVVWRLEGPGEVTVKVPEGKTRLVNLMGGEREAEVRGGAVRLLAGPYPVYVVTE